MNVFVGICTLLVFSYIIHCHLRNVSMESFQNKANSLDDIINQKVESIFTMQDASVINRTVTAIVRTTSIQNNAESFQIMFFKKLNSKLRDIPEGNRKQFFETTFGDIVKVLSSDGIDANCILNSTYCNTTKIDGACAFLLKSTKSLMTQNKDYKGTLENIKDMLENI
ncbi:hypothetical protein QKU58_gp048 [Pyramimonas orientalis virus]|uniref:Uncharacterized protein n=1 Tax=Pyramimonas orientalis virus 01B TaxID=3134525 RepID=A0A7M3UNL6_9VIRU|nr:hypothetical protein QKU58_gp048 [Pyramimonas orientalis virus]QOI90283.1 hypothetical protein HWQ62_00146 [Pyramimonas orientalis virus]